MRKAQVGRTAFFHQGPTLIAWLAGWDQAQLAILLTLSRSTQALKLPATGDNFITDLYLFPLAGDEAQAVN
ncbi:hypothetical protein FT688_02725 [Aeromonas hydrophila]|nr:hypothetical protein FT688_02725 [Aeromonas hydrophila]